jgi:hypothetical protein
VRERGGEETPGAISFISPPTSALRTLHPPPRSHPPSTALHCHAHASYARDEKAEEPEWVLVLTNRAYYRIRFERVWTTTTASSCRVIGCHQMPLANVAAVRRWRALYSLHYTHHTRNVPTVHPLYSPYTLGQDIPQPPRVHVHPPQERRRRFSNNITIVVITTGYWQRSY